MNSTFNNSQTNLLNQFNNQNNNGSNNIQQFNNQNNNGSNNIQQLCFQTPTQNVCLSVISFSNDEMNGSLSTQGIIGRGIGSALGGLFGAVSTIASGSNPFRDTSIVNAFSNVGSVIGDTII